MEGDANLASITYENLILQEDPWANCFDSIWMLGRKFTLPQQKDDFLTQVRSLIWFTYRKNFSSIGGTGPTSDAGWGCMMRCGQMVLAQGHIKSSLGDEWVWKENGNKPVQYVRILQQFVDERTSCYSIQQIARMGVEEGKSVGSWFGPNTVAQVLKRLSMFDKVNNTKVYVAMDNTICKQDVASNFHATEAKKSSSSSSSANHGTKTYAECIDSENVSDQPSLPHWQPLIIIVPLRLGLSTINPAYFYNLKRCFHWRQTIGMIGGKPNHAYFFVGHTSNDHLIFLDPHTTQDTVKPNNKKCDFDDSTFHCGSPSRMQIAQLDPSLAMSFMCRTRQDFVDLCDKVKKMKHDKNNYPLFEVVEAMPSCNMIDSRIVSVSRHNRDKKNNIADDNMCLTLDSDEDLDNIDEEFEILEIH